MHNIIMYGDLAVIERLNGAVHGQSDPLDVLLPLLVGVPLLLGEARSLSVDKGRESVDRFLLPALRFLLRLTRLAVIARSLSLWVLAR